MTADMSSSHINLWLGDLACGFNTCIECSRNIHFTRHITTLLQLSICPHRFTQLVALLQLTNIKSSSPKQTAFQQHCPPSSLHHERASRKSAIQQRPTNTTTTTTTATLPNSALRLRNRCSHRPQHDPTSSPLQRRAQSRCTAPSLPLRLRRPVNRPIRRPLPLLPRNSAMGKTGNGRYAICVPTHPQPHRRRPFRCHHPQPSRSR